MFCSNCGTELLPSAKYCHECGQKIGEQNAATPVKYVTEVCRLDVFTSKPALLRIQNSTWAWSAIAIGPNGKYTIAQSREFQALTDPSGYPVLRRQARKDWQETRTEMISKLVADGWQQTDNGDFSLNFQRVIPQK